MTAITRKLLHQLADRLAEKGVELAVSEEALSWLARAGKDPRYGARPLRRLIRDRVENPAAELLLQGELSPESILEVGVLDGQLAVQAKHQSAKL